MTIFAGPMPKRFNSLLPALLLAILLWSCRKDENIITDSSATLEFSNDSILFDTVFTTVGSSTRQLKVHNRHNRPIKIANLRLGGGLTSNFRINVDGVSLVSTGNIIIPKKDSIYIFVEVTVDPNNANSPLVIRDSIVFNVNGNVQDVKLEAWGQDAYYHKPDKYIVFTDGSAVGYSVIDCNDTWTNDKPHVIYGYAVVDSACTLTMMPGTRVHLHNKGVLWVYKDGTLKVQGSYGSRVTIQGDRLEPEYANYPGQWGFIWLSQGSKNNVIDWAIIQNGSIGIRSDTLGNSPNPTLLLSNTHIRTMSIAGLYGLGTSIRAYNCVFANCGEYTAALTIGGKYVFRHCTFANYWNIGTVTRQTPQLLMNNYYKDINNVTQIRDLDSAYFGNCIVYGDLNDEITLDSNSTSGKFGFKFENCFLRTTLNTSNANHYKLVTLNQDPMFIDPAIHFVKLDPSSPAGNKGNPLISAGYPFDIDNKVRGNPPDLGAYEN